jgi:hypothetical protein
MLADGILLGAAGNVVLEYLNPITTLDKKGLGRHP